MNAFISYELSTRELPGELEFRTDRKLGSFFKIAWPLFWIALLIPSSLAAMTADYPPEWSVGIAIGAVINLVAWPFLMALARRNPTTTLSVTSQYLAAAGRGVGPSQFRSAKLSLPASEVEWFGYMPGYVPGLYASRGLMDSNCLLPGLNREQAGLVTEAIARRFPELRPKMEPKREASPRQDRFGFRATVTRLQAGSTYAPPMAGYAPPTATYIPPMAPTADWASSGTVDTPKRGSTRPFGQKPEVISKETPDELQFRVDREFGWFGPALLLLVAVGFLIGCLTIDHPALRAIFSLISFGFAIWIGIVLARSWKRVDTTILTVTRQSFVATGAGLKAFSRSATVNTPASEVTSFGYSTGGEDDPSGLYVSCGFWKSKCLLPGLSRQQGTAVAIAIARKFPEIASRMK